MVNLRIPGGLITILGIEYISNSAEETKQIASQIAKELSGGGVIALIGDLGAGKTTFTQGFAKALKITDKIISPTFVLIRQHKLPNSEQWLFHLDLYRLEDNTKISQIGLDEIFSNQKNIVIIEWAEKILNQLPTKTIKIYFEKISENQRKITAV